MKPSTTVLRNVLGGLSLLVILFIFLASYHYENDPMPISEAFQSPSSTHLFGTDNLGRDVFQRTVIGFRNSFQVAFITQLIAFSLGVILGTLLGYYTGIGDEIIYNLMNLFLSFPMLLLTLFLSVLMGQSIGVLVAVMALYGVFYNIKLVRAETIVLRNSEFIIGLRVVNVKPRHIVFHHLLPRSIIFVMPVFLMMVGHTMIAISGFSFLGIGFMPPTPELGLIFKDAIRFVDRASYMILYPGLFQFCCILIFTLFSDLWQDSLDEQMMGGV